MLEAAGAGLPVIATRVGGIPEIFGPDSGRLVPPDDAPALAAAIASALDNPQRSREAADSLNRRVREGFSVDQMVERILAAYRTVLGSRSSIS